MSHFSKIRTQMVDKSFILKALTDMDFKAEEGEGLEVVGFGRQKTPVDIQIHLPLSYDIGLRKRGKPTRLWQIGSEFAA